MTLFNPIVTFHSFSLAHGGILLATLGIPILLSLLNRSLHSRVFENSIRSVLFILLVINVSAQYIFHELTGQISWERSLPMQLCDWAFIAVCLALVTRHPWFFEASYFWGLAGTSMAIVTPNMNGNYPLMNLISFFITHSGIVIGVLFMTFGMKMKPVRSSILRVLLWSQIYLAAALTTNMITGRNYGFLSQKPDVPSLLDLLPSWKPAYIISLNILASFLFLLLYTPFWILNRVHQNRSNDLTNPIFKEPSYHQNYSPQKPSLVP